MSRRSSGYLDYSGLHLSLVNVFAEDFNLNKWIDHVVLNIVA